MTFFFRSFIFNGIPHVSSFVYMGLEKCGGFVVVDVVVIVVVVAVVVIVVFVTFIIVAVVVVVVARSFTEKEDLSEAAESLDEEEGDSFSVRDLTWAETCSGVKKSPRLLSAAALLEVTSRRPGG